jgi:hypothetical protein
MATRKRAARGKRGRGKSSSSRGLAIGVAAAFGLSALGIWALWRTTRPPAEAPLHLHAPLTPVNPALPGLPPAPEKPVESIDAAERAKLDAVLKQRAGAADVSRRAR